MAFPVACAGFDSIKGAKGMKSRVWKVSLLSLVGILPALALLFVSGCSGSSEGSVSGNVSFEGKPLGNGSVAFVIKDKAGKELREVASIQPDGSYAIAKVPVGEVTICVETTQPVDLPKENKVKDGPPQIPMPGGGAGAEKGTYVKIPEKYKDPATSTVKYTVKSGKQKYNIELTK